VQDLCVTPWWAENDAMLLVLSRKRQWNDDDTTTRETVLDESRMP
jgi:hypothetical protein